MHRVLGVPLLHPLDHPLDGKGAGGAVSCLRTLGGIVHPLGPLSEKS